MTLNQGYSYRHVVGPDAIGHSVLSYLVSRFEHSTETEWSQRIESGEVCLNDATATAQEPLFPGSILVWNRPGWHEEDTPRQYNMIFLDEHLLVVSKPSGLPTIPGAGFLLNTLLSLVQGQFPEARPLHRLGRGTSGLVLFARTTESASQICQNWSAVKKQYQALASGLAANESYSIRIPIGPQKHPRLGHVHAASTSGKPALTIARPLERRSNTTLFEVDLMTGRPHQIRIHLAFIGHPLEGDPLYAAGGQPKSEQPGLPGDTGYFLHAKYLALKHPISGQLLEFSAPLPEVLRQTNQSRSH